MTELTNKPDRDRLTDREPADGSGWGQGGELGVEGWSKKKKEKELLETNNVMIAGEVEEGIRG